MSVLRQARVQLYALDAAANGPQLVLDDMLAARKHIKRRALVRLLFRDGCQGRSHVLQYVERFKLHTLAYSKPVLNALQYLRHGVVDVVAVGHGSIVPLSGLVRKLRSVAGPVNGWGCKWTLQKTWRVTMRECGGSPAGVL